MDKAGDHKGSPLHTLPAFLLQAPLIECLQIFRTLPRKLTLVYYIF